MIKARACGARTGFSNNNFLTRRGEKVVVRKSCASAAGASLVQASEQMAKNMMET